MSLKIADIEFIPVEIPLSGSYRPAWWPNSTVHYATSTLVRVRAEDGTMGYGSQSSLGPEVKLVGESQVVRNLLIGTDLFNIERVIRIYRA